ncbi:hypothetical protein RM553_12775 [Zunongwangia sp. F363]|uniref:Lipoprotein n=1 Tax=Autumnicola tepida TaxID=3075595 RepID=A0ABU3CBK3_9FLAO|nr:hypothetical protein [Zunongwangia sp. F363]MDT0643709.1 hypothetical protein [Zunongwangia sp. F363]
MKKLLLLIFAAALLTGCYPDSLNPEGYEMEFVFFNPEIPGEIIVSPDYQLKNGTTITNEPGGIYYVEWEETGNLFSFRFVASHKFDFLWIEQWKYEHMQDAIPFEVISPGLEYRLHEDLSYLREASNGYYRIDIQREK